MTSVVIYIVLKCGCKINLMEVYRMGLLDDVLNGGIDRDCDGDIDRHDRDLYIEECIRNDELEKERIYSQQSEDWEDCFDDEIECDNLEDDSDDYDFEDDIEDGFSSSFVPDIKFDNYIVSSRRSSFDMEKERILRGLPIYTGSKGKDDRDVIEWENMPEEKAKAAKKWYKVFIGSLFTFCLGFVLAFVTPFCCYDVVDSISPFVISGLIIGIIGFGLLIWSGSHHIELTMYYTHVVDKGGMLKYRSQYAVDKALKDLEVKEKKNKSKSKV